jgi:hypothetical protein
LRGQAAPAVCGRASGWAGGRKKGLCARLAGAFAAEAAAEVERLAAVAARSLGGPGGDGLEAVELAIRTAMTQLGCGLLERLLAADTGYRGPRAGCGAGHQAVFVSYRAKTIDTVLGPVTLRRAWYHCGDCGRGVAPKDTELGVDGASMSPGLAKMTARAAAAVPSAKATGLLTELAGIGLTVKRTERSAETTGAAAATAISAQADAICSRRVGPSPTGAGAGHALHRRRWHRRAHGGGRDRRPPATTSNSPAPWPPNATRPWPTSRPTPTGCATPTSAPWACSPAPA